MTDLRHRRPVVLRRCALLVVSAGLALALGCERDEGGQSVRQSSTGLHTLTGGATTTVWPDTREAAYAQVIDQAKAGVDGGRESADAALLITGQAQLGQADEPLRLYAAAERDYLNHATIARSLLAAYIEHSAQAAAARQYDPAQEIAGIEKGIAEQAAAIAEQQQVKGQIDAEVAGLAARAKTELDAAAALDTEAAQLREQATRATAVQGETLIRQAAEKRRAADARRMAGLQLQAQIDVTQPRSAEAGLLVDKLNNLKSDLEATRQELQDRDRGAKELAAAAGAEAAKSAEQLARRVDEIVKLRAGPLAEAADQARTRLSAAKASAQKASGAGPAAKTLVGDINQSLADLAWQRAFGHAAFAQLMETLAGVQPALSDRARYEADAKTAREEEKKALEEAKEAFDAAKSAYGSSGAKGEAKDRLERLSMLLEKSAARAGGEKLDLLAAFSAKMQKTEAGGDAPAPAPAAPAGDDLTPTLELILTSAQQNQFDPVLDLIHADTPEKQQLVSAMRSVLPAVARLDAACKEKFGQSFAEAARQTGGGVGGLPGGMGGFDQFKNLKASDLTVNITGDTATVADPTGGQPMNFTKVDGKWMIELPPLDLADPNMQMAFKAMGLMGPVFDELAAEVQAGTLQSAQAVIVAMTQKLASNPEIQQMMMQQQGGGPQ